MQPLENLSPTKMMAILERIPFFQVFTPEERREFLRFEANFYSAEADELIIKQHTADTAFFILLKGSAKVYLRGATETLDVVEPGQFFGEIAFLRNQLRTTNVAALERCILFRVDQEVLHRLGCPIREKIKDQILNKFIDIITHYNSLLFGPKAEAVD